MSAWKRLRTYLLAAIVVAAGLEVGERLSLPGVHGLVSIANAVVGRPLTPVSVAGVARRSARN